MPLPASAAFLAIEDDVADGTSPRDDHGSGNGSLPQPDFARNLKEGLTREHCKEIPSSWLYDDLGSSLFEAITLLPEYGLTRADERLIRRCAPELVDYLGASPFIAELGSGSARKTRTILSACLEAGGVDYAPIDVSEAAVQTCAVNLRPVEGLRLHPTVGDYLGGLELALARREQGHTALVLFLGSTIGNFSRNQIPSFLRSIRTLLQPGDTFLLGADLVKPAEVLELAYDDPAGVTSAFNKNLLAHLNVSFHGNFDLTRFQHVAWYNHAESRIEMFLESLEDQNATLPDLDLCVRLRRGERIRTELCHKFTVEELRDFARGAGFHVAREWIDEEWPFAESLWRI